jgi:hypothetical protein
MCYGNLDPRLQMREIDARVKHLSFEQDRTKQAAPGAPQTGLLARLRDALVGLLRKDRAHV